MVGLSFMSGVFPSPSSGVPNYHRGDGKDTRGRWFNKGGPQKYPFWQLSMFTFVIAFASLGVVGEALLLYHGRSTSVVMLTVATVGLLVLFVVVMLCGRNQRFVLSMTYDIKTTNTAKARPVGCHLSSFDFLSGGGFSLEMPQHQVETEVSDVRPEQLAANVAKANGNVVEAYLCDVAILPNVRVSRYLRRSRLTSMSFLDRVGVLNKSSKSIELPPLEFRGVDIGLFASMQSAVVAGVASVAQLQQTATFRRYVTSMYDPKVLTATCDALYAFSVVNTLKCYALGNPDSGALRPLEDFMRPYFAIVQALGGEVGKLVEILGLSGRAAHQL